MCTPGKGKIARDCLEEAYGKTVSRRTETAYKAVRDIRPLNREIASSSPLPHQLFIPSIASEQRRRGSVTDKEKSLFR